tara:strand:- start:115 stop:621 length:507 start_codon:yes stop_codon:yes gene_type:complete
VRRQRGFTLIELIIVIVILGILAVTAAPKFLNFSSDARASTVQGLAGALSSASDLVFAKAVVAGKEKATTELLTLRTGLTPIPIRFGYLDTQPTLITVFTQVLDVSDDDWDISYNGAIGTNVRLSPKGLNNITSPSPIGNISRCYVQYSRAANVGDKPQITVDIANCN